GAHQPNRRLRLAAEPQTGRREVSALTDARKTLAYDFFRILRAPPIERNGNEAEKFSDECWEKGLRLDKSPSVHYQLLMETIRWTLIPQQK
ncbi:MAG TPA: hypothetical protein K8V13_17010, partial [Enterobacter roggenkampii]|nr:hypothetical protein [Enterobacter roggenkampii]